MKSRVWSVAAVAAFGWGIACGQNTGTKKDSGWVSVFNGKDYSGLYIRTGGGTLQNPATQSSFLIEDSSLHVPRTGGVGHIATREVYSRYHVRVQYRYGKGQNSPNAGILYHIDSADWASSHALGSKNATVPYYVGAYVKSVELQMYRGDAGAFLGIMNIWVTADTKGDANHTYQAGGTPYTAIPSNDLSPRRIYRSHNAAPNDTDWVLLEGIIHGADSVTHRVNGSVVMRGRNLLHNRGLSVNADPAGRVPMDRGHVGLQTEGAEVWYRNWEVRRLRADGSPLIPGCMNPAARNYNPLANEDDKSCQAVSLARTGKPAGNRRAQARKAGLQFLNPKAGPADALGRSRD